MGPLTCLELHLAIFLSFLLQQHGVEDPKRVLDAKDGAVAPGGSEDHHPAEATFGGLKAARRAAGLYSGRGLGIMHWVGLKFQLRQGCRVW